MSQPRPAAALASVATHRADIMAMPAGRRKRRSGMARPGASVARIEGCGGGRGVDVGISLAAAAYPLPPAAPAPERGPPGTPPNDPALGSLIVGDCDQVHIGEARPSPASRRVHSRSACERRATQPAGMQRRSNAAGVSPRAAMTPPNATSSSCSRWPLQPRPGGGRPVALSAGVERQAPATGARCNWQRQHGRARYPTPRRAARLVV